MVQWKLEQESASEQVVISFNDPIEFVTATRIINGTSFSFEGREYLIPLYENESEEIYIVKGRQTEMTEYAINWLCWKLFAHPGTVGIYVTSRRSLLKKFSRDRLRDKTLRNSPIMQKIAKIKNHSIESQYFENGSILYMVSGWDEFEQARLIPADFIIVDEAQSQDIEHLDVVRETMSHSKFGLMRVIGTGSLEGSDWEKLCSSGNWMEWNATSKSWTAKRSSDDAPTYWFPQTIVPWITPEKIEKKKKKMSEYRFMTEVMGKWYHGMAKPLLEKHIRFLFDSSMDFTRPEDVDHDSLILAGVDWGGGTKAYTVVWIWQVMNEKSPIFKLLYVTKITETSTERQADMVAELIDKYKVDRAVMDAGGGTRQVEKLSAKYGNKIYRCQYGSHPGEPFVEVSGKTQIDVDRTWIIETIIDLIKRYETLDIGDVQRIWIPSRNIEKVEWLIDHFVCIEGESRDTGHGTYIVYTHPEEENDDALHACCYAYLAWILEKGTKWYWERF